MPDVIAIVKARPERGIDAREVPEPTIKPGHVKIKVEAGAICGTDLHIFKWDAWSASRIHPPRIIGHEFCGTVVEVGEGVTDRKVGDFVATESHIVCGKCLQCLHGQGHVCQNTTILGVDIDGGFAPYAVLPEANARLTGRNVPLGVAALQDALGNAVHTVMAGPVEGRRVLITGMGPIGLFSVAICKVLGASDIIVTEVSPFRKELAERMGANLILDPTKENAGDSLRKRHQGGVDATLEMSGHFSSLNLAIESTRPGGRISLLGIFPTNLDSVDFNEIIFKGLEVQGIVGRRIWETWDQMANLLNEKGLDVSPVITQELPYEQVEQAFETLEAGNAGKIVLRMTP